MNYESKAMNAEETNLALLHQALLEDELQVSRWISTANYQDAADLCAKIIREGRNHFDSSTIQSRVSLAYLNLNNCYFKLGRQDDVYRLGLDYLELTADRHLEAKAKGSRFYAFVFIAAYHYNSGVLKNAVRSWTLAADFASTCFSELDREVKTVVLETTVNVGLHCQEYRDAQLALDWYARAIGLGTANLESLEPEGLGSTLNAMRLAAEVHETRHDFAAAGALYDRILLIGQDRRHNLEAGGRANLLYALNGKANQFKQRGDGIQAAAFWRNVITQGACETGTLSDRECTAILLGMAQLAIHRHETGEPELAMRELELLQPFVTNQTTALNSDGRNLVARAFVIAAYLDLNAKTEWLLSAMRFAASAEMQPSVARNIRDNFELLLKKDGRFEFDGAQFLAAVGREIDCCLDDPPELPYSPAVPSHRRELIRHHVAFAIEQWQGVRLGIARFVRRAQSLKSAQDRWTRRTRKFWSSSDRTLADRAAQFSAMIEQGPSLWQAVRHLRMAVIAQRFRTSKWHGPRQDRLIEAVADAVATSTAVRRTESIPLPLGVQCLQALWALAYGVGAVEARPWRSKDVDAMRKVTSKDESIALSRYIQARKFIQQREWRLYRAWRRYKLDDNYFAPLDSAAFLQIRKAAGFVWQRAHAHALNKYAQTLLAAPAAANGRGMWSVGATKNPHPATGELDTLPIRSIAAVRLTPAAAGALPVFPQWTGARLPVSYWLRAFGPTLLARVRSARLAKQIPLLYSGHFAGVEFPEALVSLDKGDDTPMKKVFDNGWNRTLKSANESDGQKETQSNFGKLLCQCDLSPAQARIQAIEAAQFGDAGDLAWFAAAGKAASLLEQGGDRQTKQAQAQAQNIDALFDWVLSVLQPAPEKEQRFQRFIDYINADLAEANNPARNWSLLEHGRFALAASTDGHGSAPLAPASNTVEALASGWHEEVGVLRQRVEAMATGADDPVKTLAVNGRLFAPFVVYADAMEAAGATLRVPTPADCQALLAGDEALVQLWFHPKTGSLLAQVLRHHGALEQFELPPHFAHANWLGEHGVATLWQRFYERYRHDARGILRAPFLRAWDATAAQEGLPAGLLAWLRPQAAGRIILILPSALSHLPWQALEHTEAGRGIASRLQLETTIGAWHSTATDAASMATAATVVWDDTMTQNEGAGLHLAPRVEAAMVAHHLQTSAKRAAETSTLDLMAALAEDGPKHLAVHGKFDPRDPLSSALSLDRMRNRHIPAWLFLASSVRGDIALAACEALHVGAGDQPWLGAAGIGPMLRSRGARSVTGSLWLTDMMASIVFWRAWYAGRAAGRPRGAALAQAQAAVRTIGADELIALMAQFDPALADEARDFAAAEREMGANTPFAHPIYWANFTCLGDPDRQ